MSTYEEVMQPNPEYAKYLINENKRDNQKARVAHWVVAFMVEALWGKTREREGRDRGRREPKYERQEVVGDIGGWPT